MDVDETDAPETAAANAAWEAFLRDELGDLQPGLRAELVLLQDEVGVDEYVVALADCRSSGHRGLVALTTRRLVFVTSERSPSAGVMTSVSLDTVEVVEAADDTMRIASAGGHEDDGGEHGEHAFSHTLQAILRTDGTRALADLVLTLVPADAVRELQEVDDKPPPDDGEQGEDASVDGSPSEHLGGSAVLEEAAVIPRRNPLRSAFASLAAQKHDDELPAPAIAETAPAGIDLLETRLGERLAAVEQLVLDRRSEDTIAAEAIQASLAAAVAQLENIEQRLTAAVSELTGRLEESVGNDEQRTSALATDLQVALQEVGSRVVEVDQNVARLAQELAADQAARVEIAPQRDTGDSAGAGADLAVEVLIAELTSLEARLTELARTSAAASDQHQEVIGAAVREGAAQSDARLESLRSAVAAMAERTEQAVRAMVADAMNDVGARIEAVQSELQGSVGEPIAKVHGDVVQLAERLDRLLVVSAERDPGQQIAAFREEVLGLIRESTAQRDSAGGAMAERTEQAVRAVVADAMNDVGARIDAVQSQLQASVGEPITKVHGDVAQLAEHVDRLLLVSAERDPSQQIAAFREEVLGLIRESAQQLEQRVHGVIERAVQRDAIDPDVLVTSVDEAIARHIGPLHEALTAHLGRTPDSPAEPARTGSEESDDEAAAVEVAEDAAPQETTSAVEDWISAVLRPRRHPPVTSWSTPLHEEDPPQDGAT